MIKSSFIIATSLFLGTQSFAQQIRTFEDAKGRSIKAKFISNTDNEVTLMLNNGKEATIKISTLSTKDQEYVRNLAPPADIEPSDTGLADAINRAIGYPAFNDQEFTKRNAKDIAHALQMPLESNSSIGSSWRLYAAARKPGYRLLGATPYSVALYSGPEGKARSMSLVFANKGDYNSKVGFAEDHLKKSEGKKSASLSLEEAMEKDYEEIKSNLNDALGPGVKDYYGDSGTRHSVLRWDWNQHSFLLTLEENEYVAIDIVPTEKAESGGRSSVINDSAIRSRIVSSIKKEDNGDVFISDIPMVDQGPKGYCAPATFERAMRFVGLEADMYLLAMLGETQAGGGTSIQNLVDEIQSLIRRKGARVKEIKDKNLSIRYIKSQVDQGIPLLWVMSSGNHYNDPINKNTKMRGKEGHTDWLAGLEETYKKKQKPTSNHICMIIGYNEQTEEVAVSDSWGKRFTVRWAPLSLAEWVSSGRFVTIQP